jgi:histidinol-phosphate aminotransferase
MASVPEILPATGPRPNPGIADIPRYKPGKRAVAGGIEPIKLSSNESSFGPSPRAIESYQAAAATLHRYSDPTQAALRQAIAEVHRLDAGRIVCGNGSDELINLLIRAYVAPGDEILLTQNHFEMSSIHGRVQGAKIVLAPERSFTVDVNALIARLGRRTRMVIVANPNNPTGTYIGGADVQRLHRALPDDVLLLLDCAYAEYVTHADYDPAFTLVDGSPNTVVTRTFSKIYGLAGLRIGWVYCPAAIRDVLETIRSPFNAGSAGQAAAAAAVRDVAFMERVRDHNAAWLKKLRVALTRPGVHCVPSSTNFYLLVFDDAAGKTAVEAAAYLESHGIIPRAVKMDDPSNVLRITVGMDHENEAVIRVLGEYLDR